MNIHTDTPIAGVLIHVADVPTALDWYQRVFPQAEGIMLGDPAFTCLRLGGVQIELVPADEKVTSSPAGSVVYWQVADFEAALRHLESVGATRYRGPMTIEDGLQMCQVRDPWGNCIGLRG